MNGSVLLLALVTTERFGELWFARRNTQVLTAQGGYEVAAGHYPLIVALHTIWLAGLWMVAWNLPLHWGPVALFALLQGFRAWTLSTIGRRWTTRILVVPGEGLVSTGPYRFVKHPNYIVVIGEIAVLPLCFGMPIYAVLFSIANAVILTIRIRAENAVLYGSGDDEGS